MRRVLLFLRMAQWLGLGVSFLLFVGTVVFWVRSAGHQESWHFNRFEANSDWKTGPLAGQGRGRVWFIKTSHGRLWLGWGSREAHDAVASRIEHRRVQMSAEMAQGSFDEVFSEQQEGWNTGVMTWPLRTVRRSAGVAFCLRQTQIWDVTGRPFRKELFLAIPLWMLAVIFGVWPAGFTVRRVLRRKRFAAGMCVQCGYDLRATPQRCPECGRVVEKRHGDKEMRMGSGE